MLLRPKFSGVEKSIWELACELSRSGSHDYHLFLPDYAPVKACPGERIACHRIKVSHSRLARIIWEHLSLSKQAIKHGCDLLHCPAYITPLSGKLPMVLTVHDCFALRHPEWCKSSNRQYFGLTLRKSVKKARQIIVPSQYVREELLKTALIPEGKINVIPFACAPYFSPRKDDQQLAAIKEKYALPEQYLFFLGNQEPKKNLAGLIHAMAEIGNPEIKLVLAGSPGWGVSVTTLIKELNLADQVLDLGYVPDADLPGLYQLAEIFVFPSLAEGFGFPVLEAMACGTPVLCSDRGALPEVVGDAALIIDPAAPAGIADGILKLRADEALRNELKEKGGRQWKKFSWENTVQATEKVYEKALA